MNKIYYTAIMLLVLFCILPLACAAPSASPSTTSSAVKPQDAQIVAKLTNAYPAGMSCERALQKFASLSKEKTNGRLIIEVHSNGELYSREDEMMALSTGAVQLMSTNGSSMVAVYKPSIILNMIYFWPDYKTMRSFEATSEWQAAWNDGVDKKLGVKTLGYVPVGPAMSANKIKPIKKTADFQGLKYRSASAVDRAFYKMLGIEAVQIPITELWTALEQGMVDGFSTTFSKFSAGTEPNYGKFAGKDQSGQVEGWLFVNAAWWNNLPADIRQTLEKDVMPEVESYAISEMENVVTQCIADTTKRGVQWDAIEDIPVLKEKCQPFNQSMKKMAGNDALWEKAEAIIAASTK